MRPRRQPEIIAGRVNADGTIGAGDGFSSRRVSAGTYELTFPAGFRLLTLTGSIYGTAGVVSFVTSAGATGNVAQFFTLNSATAATDANSMFTAVGVQQ